MFLRVVRAAGGKGVKHEYVRVVEAFRENGKTRHRTILNLGRRDLLAAHLDLDKLMRLACSGNLRDRATAWWARQDSNLQPSGYEPLALTIELRARYARRARRR